MKHLFIILLALTTLLCGLVTPKRTIRINGQFNNSCGARACWAFVPVLVKSNNEVLDNTVTDDNGIFQLTFKPNKNKSFDLLFVFSDTLIFASYTTFPADTINLNISIPARKRNSNAQIVCPKCNSSKKVKKCNYPDKAIDTTYTIKLADVYYCERDKVKF